MVRRYRRKVVNRDKYSVEQTVGRTAQSGLWAVVEAQSEVTQDSRQTSYLVVPGMTDQGMRKVKHLTLTFSSTSDEPVYYALVFVPSGYSNNPINYPANGNSIDMYEPNQFIMSTGVLDFSGGPLRIRTPLSRNLNSGDSIQVIFAVRTAASDVFINWTAKYAITLQ